MTELHVDTASSTPAWEQLRDQLARYIVSGQLAADTRLPAIRQLADDLGLAPGTVARAYTELERDALITTRRAQGSFVAARVTHDAPALLERLAETFAQQAKQLGAGPDDAIRALRAAYQSA